MQIAKSYFFWELPLRALLKRLNLHKIRVFNASKPLAQIRELHRNIKVAIDLLLLTSTRYDRPHFKRFLYDSRAHGFSRILLLVSKYISSFSDVFSLEAPKLMAIFHGRGLQDLACVHWAFLTSFCDKTMGKKQMISTARLRVSGVEGKWWVVKGAVQ